MSRLIVVALAGFALLATPAQAHITEAQGTSFELTAGDGQSAVPVAQFRSSHPADETDYQGYKATIDWGDGSYPDSDVTIKSPPSPAGYTCCLVEDRHAYAKPGTYTVRVTLDEPGHGTTATVTSTATVTGPGSGSDEDPGTGEFEQGDEEGCKRTLEYGYFEVKTVGCLESAVFGIGTSPGGPRRGYVSSQGQSILVNGLLIVPKDGARIGFEPKTRQLFTVKKDGRRWKHTGTAQVMVENKVDGLPMPDIVLLAAKINWKTPPRYAIEKGTRRKALEISEQVVTVSDPTPVKADLILKSFEISDKVKSQVRLLPGKSFVPVYVDLPYFKNAQGQGVTGEMVLSATNAAGLDLESLQIRVGQAKLGAVTVNDAYFRYFRELNGDQDVWDGGATVVFPSGKVEGKLAWANSRFKEFDGALTLDAPGLPIFSTGVNMTYLRIRIVAQPNLLIGGEVVLNTGGMVAGEPAVVVEGAVEYRELANDMWEFEARAGVSLPNPLAEERLKLANAEFIYRSDKLIRFKGGFNYNFSSFSVEAGLSGMVFAPQSKFSLGGTGKVCWSGHCAGVDAVVSSVGIAACGEVGWASVGGGYRWGSGDPDFMWHSCDVGPYKVTASAAQGPDGTRSVQLHGGKRFAVIGAIGHEGPPAVRVEGPNGERIDAASNAPLTQTESYTILRNEATKTTYLIVRSPAGGAWKVTPLPESTRVVGIRQADGLPEPRVTAKVQGSGRDRKLTFEARDIPGQRIRFVERGEDTIANLGVSSRESDSIRFSPAAGVRGTRRIVAFIDQNGLTRDVIPVATYKAPARLRPGKPGQVTARRAKRGKDSFDVKPVALPEQLKISWDRAAHATGYAVSVTLSDGRKLAFFPSGKQHSLTIPNVAPSTTAKVRVVGLRPEGISGPVSRRSVGKARARR